MQREAIGNLQDSLGVSQPTITRKRAMLEKSFLEGYTVIPKGGEVGFEIVAFNLMKTRTMHSGAKERDESIKKARKWFMKQPNVVLSVAGEGLGWDMCFISQELFRICRLQKKGSNRAG